MNDGDQSTKRTLLQMIVTRITIDPTSLRIEIDVAELRRLLVGDLEADCPAIETDAPSEINEPILFKRRGVEAKIVLGGDKSATRNTDERLIRTIANSHYWFDQLASGKAASIDDLAAKAGVPASEISRALPMAFLAPSIVGTILGGRQPIELTSDRLRRLSPLPSAWKDQEQLLQIT
jgi:site-specific DNA recombinase